MTRTIVITGASDGIGAASAKQLAQLGEEVVVVGRNPDKTARVARALGVDSFVADFSDLAQVRELAASLLERYPRIDVLANNAGGVFGDRTVTRDGMELTFQVNHLAPFLLTNLLLDRLRESRASVIQTSSAAARFPGFDVDDLQAERRHSSTSAYGHAKLANVLFTKELHRRFGDQGLSAVAFHPGVIASSFGSTSNGPWKWLYGGPLAQRLMTSTSVGGARLTWLALGKPGVDWQPGGFYANNKPARTNRLADDPVVAKQLWERSAVLAGVEG
ncbi:MULTISPECIES: SDR family NAD(P)-dependent oxidoreductase [Microbacterium]|uniref:SDR family NAD(P)-dependent oxidoreductase n=1 Tax=Microbacterium TaxID=33882 RepID=UPI002787A16F|nr:MULTISPECIES: SDR family NAD(P)-dependent oxidoreductase [Microbacterium]MDQ1083700.1 NAD(P)-dependent dehydrogenase (short-subunit alcohol dehydrogenase family) [Microbacterium sp. SORGH_AS_0344]MDQ1171023.1 NAD(P)-dependent dehydrogenase (short-subunit alcohol dehydrogenase family) [Microbacterium proteolyticum]